MDNNQIVKQKILFAISLCFAGLFYEATCGIMAILLCVIIAFIVRDEKKIILPKSLFLLMFLILPIIASIVSIWAVDWGVSLYAFVKWLPIPLFIILLGYDSKDEKEELIDLIPIISAILTVVCGILYFTPLKDSFFINNRMMGTFQYANSFALLLMIGVLISLFKIKHSWLDFFLVLINICGIILTGCRAVFFLLVIGIVAWLIYFIIENKKNRNESESKGKKLLFALGIPFSFIALILIGIKLANATGNTKLFARFTQFYIHSSTFVGRYLYLADGLKLLIKHPFGLGYKGFLFIQGATQTANYEVTYAHNELLQSGLDYGIIVMLAFLIGYALVLIKKNTSFRDRLILTLEGIHLLFDWDFQFVGLIFVTILIMSSEWENTIVLRKNNGLNALKYSICTLCIFSVWLTTALAFEELGQYETAAKIYPAATTSQMFLINSSDDRHRYAESICSRNDYCPIAFQAMAEKCAQNGDYFGMAEYADKAISAAKYDVSGYEIYLTMMAYAANAYSEAGDIENTYYFMQKIADVEKTIEKVKDDTNVNAKYIYDSSDIKLGKDYIRVIKQAKEFVR